MTVIKLIVTQQRRQRLTLSVVELCLRSEREDWRMFEAVIFLENWFLDLKYNKNLYQMNNYKDKIKNYNIRNFDWKCKI